MRVLTGAGMSAESGVPTFRDALTGLWARFDPEELATEAAFAPTRSGSGPGTPTGAPRWRTWSPTPAIAHWLASPCATPAA